MITVFRSRCRNLMTERWPINYLAISMVVQLFAHMLVLLVKRGQ